MSTPAGKPFDPIKISDYAPKRVRERLAAERERRIDEQPDRPERPGREPDEVPLAPQPGEKPDAQHQAPLAPVGPHEESRRARDEDGEGADERQYDFAYEGNDEAAYSDEDASPDETVRLAEPTIRSAYAAHSEQYEVDLKRLEEDLEDLQRTGSEDAASAPPVDQRPPMDQRPPRRLRRSNETYIDGLRLPRSLEPSYLPPPPMRDRSNHLGAVLRVLIACAVAAPVTYGLIYYLSAPKEPSVARGPRIAAVETQLAPMPPLSLSQPPQAQPLPKVAPAPAPPPQLPAQAPPQPAAAPFALQSAAPSWPSPSAMSSVAASPGPANPAPANPVRVNPAPAPAPPAAAPQPVSTIDPGEIAVLLKQGEQFISSGDVVSARVLFEHAAEGGDARGALAMGTTYDPAVLAKLGVRGIPPDIAKARSWYEKARALGSSEATSRLDNLALR